MGVLDFNYCSDFHTCHKGVHGALLRVILVTSIEQVGGVFISLYTISDIRCSVVYNVAR